MRKILSPPSRVAMLDALRLDGRECAEIGVLEGCFSAEILSRNPARLYLIDPWTSQPDETYPSDHNNKEAEDFDLMFGDVQARFGDDPRVSILRQYSYFAAQGFSPSSLDFVYVDAIHTFESCLCDMLAWFPKVKTGGWLCGHDYTGKYVGVKMAVEAFCRLTSQSLGLVTDEAWASWGIQVDHWARPRLSLGRKRPDARTAVVTLCLGDHYAGVRRVTHPSLRSYADRIGADFVVLDRPEGGHISPHFEKFQLRNVLDKYSRIIYLDSDIVVSPSCPSLFDEVPEGTLGIYDEGRMGNEAERKIHARVMRAAYAAYGYEVAGDIPERPFYNTGVMVASACHRRLFDRPDREVAMDYWEQPLLNIRIAERGTRVMDLGYKFNRMAYVDPKVNEPRTDSHIIHYAGNPGFEPLATEDLRAWEERRHRGCHGE